MMSLTLTECTVYWNENPKLSNVLTDKFVSILALIILSLYNHSAFLTWGNKACNDCGANKLSSER